MKPSSHRRSPGASLTIASLACVLLATIGQACGGPSSSERFEASAAARRYPLTGIVRAVDKANRSLRIDHGPIDGLMDGMTMDFVVQDAWVLDAAAVGDRVAADLVLDGARSWLEGVVITKADSSAGAAGAAAATANPDVVPPGTPLPDVTFVDQDGREVTPSTYEGTRAVYTFIYTRCPLPDYCPLMMRRLNEIAARLDAAGHRDDVWLLAVTLDPSFDRPPVLKAFGDRLLETGPDGARYQRTALLTGDPEAIRRFAATFQLAYEADGDEVVHGLRTVVVDGDARVVRTFRGNEWHADEVVEALGFGG